MAQQRALLILGMHRSGTSALTRLLNLCGAALPEDVLPPNASNTAGYWEPRAVVMLHDRLLAAAASGWDDPATFPAAWFESADASRFVDELAGLVVAEFGDAPLMVIKDPRACRLLPLWDRALVRLGIEPLVILQVRHPLEVAASLEHRDGLAVSQSLLMWLQHLLAAEAASRAHPRLVVSYEQVLEDWRSVLTRVETRFGLSLPVTAEVEAAIQAFLDPALRHERSQAQPVEVPARLREWTRRTYAWCERASRGDPMTGDTALDDVESALQQVDDVYAPSLRRRYRAERDQAARHAHDRQEREQQLSEESRLAREGEWRERAEQAQREAEQRLQQAEHWRLQVEQQAAREADLQRALSEVRAHVALMEQRRVWRLANWLSRQRARWRGR